MLDHSPQLADLASVEWQLVEVGQPAIGALGQLGERTTSSSLRHTERLPQGEEVVDAEL